MPVESLDWLRADPERWAHVDYVRGVDDDGVPGDVNRSTRELVLGMLARDHLPDDAELVRYLLRQEIAAHEASWGYGDSLGAAALLLVDCGAVEDVWLVWQAKNANVDTFIGIDRELLFGAGVAETLEFVRASDHRDRDELLEYVNDGVPTEEDIRALLGWLREYHRF
ncbi:hypothetical protein [Prauserella cavernicola]|uniref:Uncharacterized protein n=1 Tax=Prauserella cavernicola TaxID=2800127 RepID=A0A934QVN7_9PSEU|nr:hypothetical protein [Prauserella cavernicola]MBK1787380.1 hypothetical protein [Prauserella cavernicola]